MSLHISPSMRFITAPCLVSVIAWVLLLCAPTPSADQNILRYQ